MAQLGSLQWEGPDLGPSNPMIALAALRQLWDTYGTLVLAAFGLLFLVLVLLWIALESFFRGGSKGFWTYLGTGVARTALLIGTAVMFIMLSVHDESGGTLLIGFAVMPALWSIVGLMEALVRRDAVELLATDLLTLVAVVGCLRLLEGTLGLLLLGSAAVAFLESSKIVLAGLFAAIVVLLWMIAHSYLVAVRYSAIDIMRRNVVGS
jgi:hypothetical protein